jgi:hypothetical protein
MIALWPFQSPARTRSSSGCPVTGFVYILCASHEIVLPQKAFLCAKGHVHAHLVALVKVLLAYGEKRRGVEFHARRTREKRLVQVEVLLRQVEERCALCSRDTCTYTVVSRRAWKYDTGYARFCPLQLTAFPTTRRTGSPEPASSIVHSLAISPGTRRTTTRSLSHMSGMTPTVCGSRDGIFMAGKRRVAQAKSKR